MDVFCIVEHKIRLSEPTRKTFLNEPLAYNNQQAHLMRVEVYDDDGAAVNLSGATVTASFLKANDATVEPIEGTVTGNVAEVVLPASCYATPGRFKFTMNLNKTGYSRTVMWVEGMVEKNTSSTIIDPGTPVTNYSTIISEASAAASAAAEAAANAEEFTGAIAPDYADLTFPVSAGTFCWHSGDLYIANQDIPASESWTAAHWDSATIGGAIGKISSGLSERIDTLHNLVDYGYSTDSDLSMNSGAFTITRNGTHCTASGTLVANSTSIMIRVNGTLDGTAGESNYKNKTGGMGLTDGHIYRWKIKHISGTISVYGWEARVYTPGTQSKIAPLNAVNVMPDGTKYCDFAYSSTDYPNGIKLTFYINRNGSEATFTGAVFECLLEDITYALFNTLTDFGASGNGTTDDTAAIKRALTACAGRTLYVPAGTYLFSETLEIESGTRIIGCGVASKFKLKNTYTLTPYAWRTGDPLVADQYRYPMVYMDTDTDGIILENFAIEGQTSAFYDKNFDCLTIRGNNHIARNLVITKTNFFPSDFSGRTNNGVGRGINVQGAKSIIVENCVTEDSGYEGIGVEDADTVTVQNCVCTHALQTTAQIHRSATNIRLIGNTFDNTDRQHTGSSSNGPSLTLHASTDYPMGEIMIDNNTLVGTFVFANGGAENGVKIVNNRMGGISLNAIDGWRDKCIVIGNTLMSQLNLKSDNAIICGNMVYHTGGGNMIDASGNNIVCFGNIPLNSTTKGVRIRNHDGDSTNFADMTMKFIDGNGTVS